MKFKIDQSVKVKKGIQCPDDSKFDLSGWQGRIMDIDEGDNNEQTIGISWDSVTLKAMPKEYIEESEIEGLDWAYMYLLSNEIDLAEPRDTQYDVDEIRNQLEDEYIGPEGIRIQAVINSAKSDDDFEIMGAWEEHLTQVLKFPFDTVIAEYQDKGPLKQDDKLKVFGIEGADDHYGIIVSCKMGRSHYDFPLVDLAVIDTKSDNAQHIEDYRIWFSSR